MGAGEGGGREQQGKTGMVFTSLVWLSAEFLVLLLPGSFGGWWWSVESYPWPCHLGPEHPASQPDTPGPGQDLTVARDAPFLSPAQRAEAQQEGPPRVAEGERAASIGVLSCWCPDARRPSV